MFFYESRLWFPFPQTWGKKGKRKGATTAVQCLSGCQEFREMALMWIKLNDLSNPGVRETSLRWNPKDNYTLLPIHSLNQIHADTMQPGNQKAADAPMLAGRGICRAASIIHPQRSLATRRKWTTKSHLSLPASVEKVLHSHRKIRLRHMFKSYFHFLISLDSNCTGNKCPMRAYSCPFSLHALLGREHIIWGLCNSRSHGTGL